MNTEQETQSRCLHPTCSAERDTLKIFTWSGFEVETDNDGNRSYVCPLSGEQISLLEETTFLVKIRDENGNWKSLDVAQGNPSDADLREFGLEVIDLGHFDGVNLLKLETILDQIE